MYQVSVSIIEKFRRFMMDVSQYDTEQSLLDAIMGKFVPNDKTRIGSAYHKIIENFNREISPEEMYVDDLVFTQEQAQPAVDYKWKQHPHMVSEVPGFKIYHTNQFTFKITGRADGVEGHSIRDAKLKFSTPNWLEYLHSSQWKFYLDMFDAQGFFYDVFEVQNYNGIINNRLPGAKILQHEPYMCLAYEDMNADLNNLLQDFSNFISHKNYTHLLKQVKS